MKAPFRFRASKIGAAVVLAAALGMTMEAGGASAAILTDTWGAPGIVRTATPFEGNCRDYMASGNWTYATVNTPSVWARALTNGSTRQLVSARAVLMNNTTQAETAGPWSAWYSTTTTVGVTLPNLEVAAPWNPGADALLLQIWWYDPTSRTYTAYREFAMTYLNKGGRVASSC